MAARKNGAPASKQDTGPAKVTLSVGAGAKQKDSVGLQSGLSEHAPFDSEAGGPVYDYSVSPVSGMATERIKSNPAGKSVSSKGKTFEIC
jgi:hypothetical protein